MKKILILALASLTFLGACVQTTAPKNEQDSSTKVINDEAPVTVEPVSDMTEAEWTLVSGKLPYADPDPIVYEGNVELKGWIVYKPVYVGDPEPHFYVADESLDDLPTDLFGRTFYLGELSESNLNELLKYNESEAGTILVDKFTVVMEGSPRLNMVKIVQ